MKSWLVTRTSRWSVWNFWAIWRASAPSLNRCSSKTTVKVVSEGCERLAKATSAAESTPPLEKHAHRDIADQMADHGVFQSASRNASGCALHRRVRGPIFVNRDAAAIGYQVMTRQQAFDAPDAGGRSGYRTQQQQSGESFGILLIGYQAGPDQRLYLRGKRE